MKTIEEAVPGDIFRVWWCPECLIHSSNWDGDEILYCAACQKHYKWDEVLRNAPED